MDIEINPDEIRWIYGGDNDGDEMFGIPMSFIYYTDYDMILFLS